MVAATTLALAGCSLWEPPAAVKEVAEELVTQIREIDGVASAEVEVRSRDPKDHHNDWILSFAVTATNSAGLEPLPPAVGRVVASASFSVYAAYATLTVPARIGIAEVVLQDLGAESVVAAERLRAIPEVEAVRVGGTASGTSVTARPGASLPQIAASLRAVDGFGVHEPLLTAAVQWTSAAPQAYRWAMVGAATPGVEMLDVLQRLGDDSSVDRIYATQSVAWGDLGDAPYLRPSISIEADDPESVVELLTATRDAAAEAGSAPRTGFRVTSAGGGELSGFVGLPLGAPEPQDLPAPPEPEADAAAPLPAGGATAPAEWVPSDDPAVLAQLDVLTAEVAAFLDNTERIAGVTAEHTVRAEQCSQASGTSIRGDIVLPIFEVTDSADEAFAAITADWVSNGLVQSDRALGLDIYGTQLLDATVTGATIRGTTDGISISANSACVS